MGGKNSICAGLFVFLVFSFSLTSCQNEEKTEPGLGDAPSGFVRPNAWEASHYKNYDVNRWVSPWDVDYSEVPILDGVLIKDISTKAGVKTLVLVSPYLYWRDKAYSKLLEYKFSVLETKTEENKGLLDKKYAIPEEALLFIYVALDRIQFAYHSIVEDDFPYYSDSGQ
ncbi:hypothetical protein [Treponema endosymbiont of Eucomonympha sp.]|uniref:hypothetical protein n=1 Tax=Treponema endosymbiont of Eucomonympha sp. TaxID=1580831 RepID=UPI000B0D8AED|nr:hypothetical protein [Treponema endosymbiont of Eucomonympha sp.]